MMPLPLLPHEGLRQQGAEKGQDDGGEVLVFSSKAFDLSFSWYPTLMLWM